MDEAGGEPDLEPASDDADSTPDRADEDGEPLGHGARASIPMHTPALGSTWPRRRSEVSPPPPRQVRRTRSSQPRIDPRAEGPVNPVAERVIVPANLSDPLGMHAGQSMRAKSAPPPSRDELSATPRRSRQHTPTFIRPQDHEPGSSAEGAGAKVDGPEGPEVDVADPRASGPRRTKTLPQAFLSEPPPAPAEGSQRPSPRTGRTIAFERGSIPPPRLPRLELVVEDETDETGETSSDAGLDPRSELGLSDSERKDDDLAESHESDRDSSDIGVSVEAFEPTGDRLVLFDADRNPDESGRALALRPDASALRPAFGPGGDRASFPWAPQAEEDIVPAAQLADQLASATASSTPRLVERAIEMGPLVLSELVRVFPGDLWFDRNRTRLKPPPAKMASGPAAALAALGDDAVPHVATLLASSDAKARYCAALVARELRHPYLIDPLLRMLVDADTDMADAGMLALRTIDADSVSRRIAPMHETLGKEDAPAGQCLLAAKTLGALRVDAAVPVLIEQLGNRARDVQDAALRSLSIITAQGFGKSRFRWRRWFKKHGGEPRSEWLLEGLGHSEMSVRVTAMRELILWTGEDFGIHRIARREDAGQVRDEYARLLERRSD